MKAAWYSTSGEARQVLVVGEIETPVPGTGEVLVKLATSGVNPSDVKSRRRPLLFDKIIPHSDGAGVIDAVGAGVSDSRIGERVWIWNGQWQRPFGTAAEYIVVPEMQAVRLPDSTDFAAGACFGIPLLTALQAVRLLGDVADRSILVTGAASAVGHYVTQIAASRGAKVIGTASSPDKLAHAKKAGCIATIDYKAEPVAERIKALTDGRGVDAIVDMDLSTTAGYLREGAVAAHGRVVCYGSNVPQDAAIPFRELLFKSIDLQFFLVYDLLPEDRRTILNEVTALLNEGWLQHTIAARYPLADIAAAHEAVEAGKTIGNVIIDLGRR